MALLIDQYTLAADVTFQKRVEQSVVVAAVAIAAEADSTGFHKERIALATKILQAPSNFTVLFSTVVAADSTVATAASSPPVQANVTDAQINTAVSGVWNAVAGARG